MRLSYCLDSRMTEFDDEIIRIRESYAKRDAAGKPALYKWHRQGVLYDQYRLRSVVAKLLAGYGLFDLSGKDILDIGCGGGGWLRTLMEWGADPERLHGTELLHDRLDIAGRLSPQIDCRPADTWSIPFPDSSMDLVSAHTVLSSILDPLARLRLAEEMIRVMKPGGRALVYDFRISHPRNKDTVGIRKREIKRLFPGLSIERQSMTLAPPLQRRLTAISPLLTHACEALFPILRSHAIYLISKEA